MQRKNIKLEEIVELYNTYNNIGIIAEKLNCCTANISKRLKKAGISINRDYSKRRKSSREKLYVDESYFKSIDTEDKAYFLGLMYADGSLILNANRSHNCLNFTSGSLEFLQQLQDNLKDISITNGGISKEKNYEVWHLRYGGKQVHIVLDWLYNSSNLYLKRKYNKYLLSN